jgi:hypothetical protein
VARETFSYNLHDELTVTAPVRLPELERFRVRERIDAPSVRVSIPASGSPWAASDGARPVRFGGRRVRYHDGLGRLGFGMEIMYGAPGETIDVQATPLLARSPHVLYTNVLEPILRWLFVEKGYALVHGACVAVDDRAYLITARTDTGKTTTILRLLDNYRDVSFLSDDLTLVRPDGTVLSYPKPLTISMHTVVAVHSPLLTRRERMTLPLQSRLHSKSGRLFGMFLARTRLPMATMNGVVQFLVPPPKYQIDRLVPHVTFAKRTVRLAGVFVIERGEDSFELLTDAEATRILVENSDDAYGFPPYHDIKHVLYQTADTDLRPLEQATVAKAVAGLPAVLLRNSTRDWWRQIPIYMSLSTTESMPEPRPAQVEATESYGDLAGVLTVEPAQLPAD